jgi:hypothetical protein
MPKKAKTRPKLRTLVRKKVRVVTPTHPKTKSIKAFFDQLKTAHGWLHLDFRVYSAANDTDNLDTIAQYAVDDAPDAILACGSMAATIVCDKTDTCKVVFVGGVAPVIAPSNLYGYTIDGVTIANHHLSNLNVPDVAVMYDPQNDPSQYIITNMTVPTGVTIHLFPVSDPADFASQSINYRGFMLIPNAMYYHHRKRIIKLVDSNSNVTAIYYPEREYKDDSNNQGKVKVHGYKIPETYQKSGRYRGSDFERRNNSAAYYEGRNVPG